LKNLEYYFPINVPINAKSDYNRIERFVYAVVNAAIIAWFKSTKIDQNIYTSDRRDLMED
jgi:hypothetical protein